MHSEQGTLVPEAISAFHPGLVPSDFQTEAPPQPLATVDAHLLLHDVLRQLKRQIDAKRLELNLQLSARGYLIRGDRERMQLVYQNLIGNAITNARKGALLTVRSTCPSPEALRVEVSHCTAR